MPALDALNMQRGPLEVQGGLPTLVFTGTGADPRPRVRVDNSQTAFWEGRQFRIYHEFNIAAGQSIWFRAIALGDVIVLHRDFTIVQGNMRFALGQGGTVTGAWTPKTIWPINDMASAPDYIGTATFASGATSIAGMAERDVLVAETGTSQATSVRTSAEEAGLPAGTYYSEIRNTGSNALRGLYTVIWEEQEPKSSLIY